MKTSENPLVVMAAGLFTLLTVFAMVLAVAGCATVEPNSVRVYGEHVSHLTQHEPFTDHPTNYGYNAINVEAHWQSGPVFVDVAEGYVLESKLNNACGGLY